MLLTSEVIIFNLMRFQTMIRSLVFFPILLLLFFRVFSQPPCKIRSAKIDFVFSTGFQTGTKTIIFDDFKIWYWKGIALKKEMNIDNLKIYEYATFIDEDYKIKVDEFLVPRNIKMQ